MKRNNNNNNSSSSGGSRKGKGGGSKGGGSNGNRRHASSSSPRGGGNKVSSRHGGNRRGNASSGFYGNNYDDVDPHYSMHNQYYRSPSLILRTAMVIGAVGAFLVMVMVLVESIASLAPSVFPPNGGTGAVYHQQQHNVNQVHPHHHQQNEEIRQQELQLVVEAAAVAASKNVENPTVGVAAGSVIPETWSGTTGVAGTVNVGIGVGNLLSLSDKDVDTAMDAVLAGKNNIASGSATSNHFIQLEQLTNLETDVISHGTGVGPDGGRGIEIRIPTNGNGGQETVRIMASPVPQESATNPRKTTVPITEAEPLRPSTSSYSTTPTYSSPSSTQHQPQSQHNQQQPTTPNRHRSSSSSYYRRASHYDDYQSVVSQYITRVRLPSTPMERRHPPSLCSDGYTYGYSDWNTLQAAISEINQIDFDHREIHRMYQLAVAEYKDHHSQLSGGSSGTYPFPTYPPSSFDEAMQDDYDDDFGSSGMPTKDPFVICPGSTLKTPWLGRARPIYVNAEDVVIQCGDGTTGGGRDVYNSYNHDTCTINVPGTHFKFGPNAKGVTIRGLALVGASTSSLTFHHHGADVSFEDCFWIGNTGGRNSGAVADMNSTSSVTFYRCEITETKQAPRVSVGNPTGVVSSLTIHN